MQVFAGTPPAKVPVARRTALDQKFADLKASLSQCSTDFKAMTELHKAQEIKESGVTRLLQTENAIQSFETAGYTYMLSLGVKIRPYGAGVSPLAGGATPTQ
jgi:hypothetical protein